MYTNLNKSHIVNKISINIEINSTNVYIIFSP